ncbi:MAG: 4-oxalocrotonate tautomerase [Chloroflexi bacterium]|nr:4-oxalocrotonate tautomerase [Chloroflexota bacterium]|tara:strand:+ start:367 stop:630 length:264 start_codon:yes stop_codon:yes gene_type:complete
MRDNDRPGSYNSGFQRTSVELQEKTMPVVNVAMYAGRTDQQKADLAKAITKAISETAEIPDSATTVIFQEVEKTAWAVGGVMVSEDQ